MNMMGTVIIGEFQFPYPGDVRFAPPFRTLTRSIALPENGHSNRLSYRCKGRPKLSTMRQSPMRSA